MFSVSTFLPVSRILPLSFFAAPTIPLFLCFLTLFISSSHQWHQSTIACERPLRPKHHADLRGVWDSSRARTPGIIDVHVHMHVATVCTRCNGVSGSVCLSVHLSLFSSFSTYLHSYRPIKYRPIKYWLCLFPCPFLLSFSLSIWYSPTVSYLFPHPIFFLHLSQVDTALCHQHRSLVISPLLARHNSIAFNFVLDSSCIVWFFFFE